MPVRLIERTPDAYAYPLLIKQLGFLLVATC